MTPEPIPPPFPVVTFTCTTAGFTFAITASRTASILLLLSAGTVAVGAVLGSNVPTLLVPEAALVLPNCQPANRPTPKMTASSTTRSRMAPARAPRRQRERRMRSRWRQSAHPGADCTHDRGMLRPRRSLADRLGDPDEVALAVEEERAPFAGRQFERCFECFCDLVPALRCHRLIETSIIR